MQQRSSIKYSMATLAWSIIMSYSLFAPARDLSVPGKFAFEGADKIVHFVLFATLTFLVVKAMRERKMIFSKWKVALFLSIYAILTELIQLLIEDRNGDVMDVVADVAGVLAVLIFSKDR